MTPAEKAGVRVGDIVEIVESCRPGFSVGERFELESDDGSNAPYFCRVCSDGSRAPERNCLGFLPIEGPGSVGFAIGTRVKKVAPNTVGGDDPSAAGLLHKAAALIGDRGAERDHEDGERSMARCVSAFNAMTGHKLSEEDGWLFMQYLKQARAKGGAFKQDDYEDNIAYAALQAECAIKENTDES